jgi:probable HAF family extracellular repeat protein
LLVKSSEIVAVALFLWGAFLVGEAAAEPVLYRVTDLGVLAGDHHPAALALNDVGQVVGSYGQTAFLWSESTGMQDLGIPAAFYSARGVGINESGQVAVAVGKNSVPWDGHAFRWSAGVYEDMGTFGGTYSVTYGIDDTGRLAGYAYTTLGAIHAYRSTTGTTLDDIDSLGGDYSLGYGINAAGHVVGQAYNASKQHHAFLWTGSGSMQDLGTLGGTQSQANDISDSGIIIGDSSTAGNAAYHAFILRNGAMTDLGSLTEHSSWGVAVNDAAQVIGQYSDGEFGHPYLWEETNGMRNLNTLLEPISGTGWTLFTANDINNRGQIVGQGRHNGLVRAFLLTPVPEPGALVLLVSGASACVVLRKRHAP